jgi:hypothetical protein
MGRTLGGMTSREWTCSGLSKPPKRASTPQESRTSRTPRSGTCAMFVPRRPKMASNSRVPTFSGIDTLISRLSVTVHPRSCIAAAMTTTIWRPHWLIKPIEPVKEEVPDDDVPDVKVEPPADDDGINGEDGTTPSEGKGAKRKRAPPTKGPCEHGVKPRSKCKVCSACPHGRRRSRCKECGGSQICEHGRMRSVCKECGGASICEHGRQRQYCKECGGGSICEHGRVRSACKECGGGSVCEHGRQRSVCKECGGSGICEHGRVRSVCKECGGSGICEHGRVRSACKECGGGSICEHGRRRSTCKECGGSGICEHGRERYRCKECKK